MEVIRDKDGKVINSSKNMRGIRRYVSNHLIKMVAIDKMGEGPSSYAQLRILFDDGASYETNYYDFDMLKYSIRNWRNLEGAPLMINGIDSGKVGKNNELLK